MSNEKNPGFIPPLPKSENDGKIKELSKFTKPELLDLLQRQKKILSNTIFISNLPDKGAKISTFIEKLEEQIKCKEKEESLAVMLKKLSLNPIDKETVQNVEWKRKLAIPTVLPYLDSDDDSEPEEGVRLYRRDRANEPYISVSAIQPNKTSSKEYPKDQISHLRYVVEKTETSSQNAVEKFKPYKTTKSDVHDPFKEGARKKHKNWEVTAATPPPSVHGPAKVLTLEKSVKLQMDQDKLIQEVQIKNSVERLTSKLNLQIGQIPESATSSQQYRELDSDDIEASEDENATKEGSDNEIHDEEPERGGVAFTVMK